MERAPTELEDVADSIERGGKGGKLCAILD